MLASEDFWPDDIGTTDLLTPLAILREQSAALGPKTNNLVTGEVVTSASGGNFIHRLNLDAPALGYRYELLQVLHQIQLYPVWGSFAGKSTKLDDEAAFREWLRAVLSSDETKRIVRALIAQSQA
jgi:hypothetical protein